MKPKVKIKQTDKDLSKEAMEFVKNNCMTWCNFEGCSTRECEKKTKTMKARKTLFEKFIITCFFIVFIAWVAFIIYVIKNAS